MKTAVIVAMERELDALHAAGVGRACVAGIGKVNAARAATEMILRERPDCIVNSGVAGGLSSRLRVGDIVLGEAVAYHDVWCGAGNLRGQVQGMPARFAADPVLLDAARHSVGDAAAGGVLPGGTLHCGLIVSGDEFVDNAESEDRIAAMYPDALACDMESAAIAQVCHAYGLPFLCMRVISDVRGAHMETYGGFWQDVSGVSFAALRSLLRRLEGCGATGAA